MKPKKSPPPKPKEHIHYSKHHIPYAAYQVCDKCNKLFSQQK